MWLARVCCNSNRLVRLPAELSMLGQLVVLDVSSNQLEALPDMSGV